jgi:uncharacterized protein (DUF2235 family)
MPLYAFDGTWNAEKTDDLRTIPLEAGAATNVVKFRNAYDRPDTCYVEGVGAGVGLIGRILDGAFVAGGGRRIDEALAHLIARWEAGAREIDVVGCSRGAALALAFARRVCRLDRLRDGRGRPPRIRFLGLFDVVPCFGVPVDLSGPRVEEYNVGYRVALPPNVEYGFHAMALDERRRAFRLTRVGGAYEVWFRGAHADVGGGNENLGLNAIALGWMLRKAAACGLPIADEALRRAALAAASTTRPLFSFDRAGAAFRTVHATDRVHYTVSGRAADTDLNHPPAGCPREDPVAELVPVRSPLFDAT